MNNISSPLQFPARSASYANTALDEDNIPDNSDNGDAAERCDGHSTPVSTSLRTETSAHELWTKTPRARGRKARDADAEYVRFNCKDIDDLETNLRDYLAAPTASAEHATIECSFPSTAAFMVYTRDFKRDSSSTWTSADVTDLMRKTAVSVTEVLQPTDNPKNQIIRQKAVARTIVEAVQRADKFRYSFHNNWLSKEDQAHRFSFFCNDSTLNKGRAANGGAGTEGRGLRKPAYDCKGLIAVKFSVTKNNLEVHYRHIPLHKTFDERAPIPRRESKRRRMMEALDPEALKALRDGKRQKLQEERQAAGWVRRKGDRPQSSTWEVITGAPKRRRRGEAAHVNSADRLGVTDEVLQPLTDFLDPPQSTSPDSRWAGNEIQDDNNDTVILIDDGVESESDNEGTIRLVPDPATRDKQSEVQNSAPARRAKLHGPLLPGMMEGSLQSGNMSWNVHTSSESALPQATHEVRSKPRTERSRQKQKDRSERGKDGQSAKEKKEYETEIELLKRRLHETEQRLLRIEAEKAATTHPNVPPPYPPPFYPQYPYYSSYSLSHYPPLPPPGQPYVLPPQCEHQQHQPALVAATPSSQHQQQPTPELQLKNSVTRSASVQEDVRANSASQSAVSAEMRHEETRPPTSPSIQTQNVNSTRTGAAKAITPPYPSGIRHSQGIAQSPSQTGYVPSASTSRPRWLGWPQARSNTQNVEGHMHRESDSQHLPGPADNTTANDMSRQPQMEGILGQHKGPSHNSLLVRPRAEADSSLKGLFDSALAAVVQPEVAEVAGPGSSTAPIFVVQESVTRVDTAVEPAAKRTKEPYSASLPPQGVSSFQLPSYQNERRQASTSAKAPTKSTTSSSNAPQSVARPSQAEGRPTAPTETQGPSPATPLAQPPYPYAPFQYIYTPYYSYPPPSGQPPCPPYPPPPGFGYSAHPAYPYPFAAPLPETEEQRRVREHKEKDDTADAPSWAAQLREAMTGYANSTPASSSVSAAKNMERESARATSREQSRSVRDSQVDELGVDVSHPDAGIDTAQIPEAGNDAV